MVSSVSAFFKIAELVGMTPRTHLWVSNLGVVTDGALKVSLGSLVVKLVHSGRDEAVRECPTHLLLYQSLVICGVHELRHLSKAVC